KIWGQPAEQFYKNPGLRMESVAPEDRERVQELWNACANGITPRFETEYRIEQPDRGIRWVLDSGTAIRNEEGLTVRMSGVIRDITERKHAEGVLHGVSRDDIARRKVRATKDLILVA